MIVRYLWVPVLTVAAAVAVATPVLAAPGDITLASTSDAGVKGNHISEGGSLSADGTTVVFDSNASNLDPGDTDSSNDIYAKDLTTGDITLVSTSDAGVKGNNSSSGPSISSDGTTVAFRSEASNLDPGDTDGITDIYVKDLTTGDITLASTSDTGVKANAQSIGSSISADGTRVAFHSFATNLDPGDTDDAFGDIYVKDLTTGNITLASTSDAEVKGNNPSFSASISADGNKVAFLSGASNLDPGDTDGTGDIYAKDLTTGDITLASTSDEGVKGNSGSSTPRISADGNKVAFFSGASNLDPGDTDSLNDIYVKDFSTGDITLASTSDAGVKGDSSSFASSISADGTIVAFYSSATNLDPGDSDTVLDVYVKDLATGDITLASTSDAGVKGNDHSSGAGLSADGNKVAFRSSATNLDPGDTDSLSDIYVKELGSAPAPSADLSVRKSDGRGDPATVGSKLTYKVLVRNFGPDAATGVTLTDELPAEVTFVSARSPSRRGITCAHAGGIVTCDLGTLASGGRGNVNITVTPNSPGTITNTAEVSGNEADPKTANNQDSETTTVQ